MPVLRGKVPAIDEDAPSPADPGGIPGAWVILGGGIQPSLEAELSSILARDAVERAALFLQLVERILERASGPLLSYPIGLTSVGVTLESNAVNVAVPALDLGAYLANQTGDARHLKSLAPYLAPEYLDGPPADWRAALTYNLGAMGQHLLTGHAPTGEAGSIPDAAGVAPDLASILDRMLSTDPTRRPAGGELLKGIRAVIPDASSTWLSASSNADASALESDEILAELEDSSLAFEGPRKRPSALSSRAASSAQPARPARPISRRRRAARRSSGLLYLPLWILVWVGLFFAARHLSKMVFRELGL